MDRYNPSHIYIKNMRSPFEVPELQVHCEVVCIAEPLIELQCRQLWSVRLNFEWMSRQWNQISLSVQAGNKSSLSFSNYIPL